MPGKNTIKVYTENGYYHIYNRGVEKRNIFVDKEDYSFFLDVLANYLLDSVDQPFSKTYWRSKLAPNEVSLLAYCLMPNHFHFLLKQNTINGITKLFRRLATSYVLYFNKKYQRVGSLFQGVFKAVFVDRDEYLLHLSRYIHRQPFTEKKRSLLLRGETSNISRVLEEYPFFSYPDYLGKRKTPWVDTTEILGYFKSAQKTDLKDRLSYQSFVEDYEQDDQKLLENFTLEG